MTGDFQTKLNLRIDWADLDLFGHVNNVMFFKYIQAARVNYCDLIGLTSLNDPEKMSFMVASSHCNFKRPLLYPGTIKVLTRIAYIKTTSLQLSYQILNDKNELCAEAEDVLVTFDYKNKTKIAVPADIRDAIRKLDGRSF